MGFKDLTEFLREGPIELPIAGKVYQFPASVSAKTWFRFMEAKRRSAEQALRHAAGEEVDLDAELMPDIDEAELYREIMGDGLKELLAGGVTPVQIQHVYNTLLVYHMYGREAAVVRWMDPSDVVPPEFSEGGDPGEAPAPDRKTTRSIRLRGSLCGSISQRIRKAFAGLRSWAGGIWSSLTSNSTTPSI